ncbi:MAG: hypothetical protein ACYC3X_18115 [Pirellulaceae bacterium]
MFPQVDPIPLPAPVWLFKVLEVLTVSLHFAAVQLLLGGLILSTIWAFRGRAAQCVAMRGAAGSIATRLPIVMVYVINFGVPPLLFAQVLYGRAIYTSSILIGVAWISVIGLLMVVYSLLYVAAARAQRGEVWWWISLLATGVAGLIALIYSSNMTLMIRPQAWLEMYRSNPLGLRLNLGDPTVWPRWLFMVTGGVCTCGVGLLVLGLVSALSADTRAFLRHWGTRLAAGGVAVQVLIAGWVVAAQPESVRKALLHHAPYVVCMVLWLVLAVAVLVLALRARHADADSHWRWAGLLGGLVFANIAVVAIVRGGIRDLTLQGHGLNVWDRRVEANWLVTSAFLVLFVVGLAVITWLLTVVARAKKVEERYV